MSTTSLMIRARTGNRLGAAEPNNSSSREYSYASFHRCDWKTWRACTVERTCQIFALIFIL